MALAHHGVSTMEHGLHFDGGRIHLVRGAQACEGCTLGEGGRIKLGEEGHLEEEPPSLCLGAL